jgi:hypothetical protein
VKAISGVLFLSLWPAGILKSLSEGGIITGIGALCHLINDRLRVAL